MWQKRRSDQGTDGFTIVEILIVLAIAGIMLGLVFEAIPTLSRSSRNNQRKQDIANISEALSHYELNNSGNFPADSSFIGGIGARLSYYDASASPGDITVHSQTAVTAATAGTISPISSVDNVAIYDYERCSTTVHGEAEPLGAGFRDAVALYAIETGGAASAQCQKL